MILGKTGFCAVDRVKGGFSLFQQGRTSFRLEIKGLIGRNAVLDLPVSHVALNNPQALGKFAGRASAAWRRLAAFAFASRAMQLGSCVLENKAHADWVQARHDELAGPDSQYGSTAF